MTCIIGVVSRGKVLIVWFLLAFLLSIFLGRRLRGR